MTQPPPSYPPPVESRPGPDPARVAAHPHPEPRSYALTMRTWTFAMWRPGVGIPLLILGGFVVMPLALLPVLAIGVALESGEKSYIDRFYDATQMTSLTPASMLYLNLTLASLTLVAWALMRWLHNLRPRWLTSVNPGLRWKFFWACLGLSLVALAAQFGVGLLLPDDPNGLSTSLNEMTPRLIGIAIVILLTTPLQAIGEEYAFRGYLTQAVGAITHGGVERFPKLSERAVRGLTNTAAVVIPAVLFAFAHGAQNFPLFFDRFAFGLIAGYVVLRTGGLEAGIALHVFNNLFAFGITILFGNVDTVLTATEASWMQLPLTITQNGVYLVLVLLVAKRMGIRSTSTPPGFDRSAPVV